MRPKQFFEEKYGEKSKQMITLPGERIYIGGLPHYFTDEQVKKICETFGKLKYLTIIKENGVSKGYGFFEYDDPKKTDRAIESLNNLPIADRRLKCQKATVGGGRTISLGYSGA
jgi:splicing factor U2AF subunit